MKFIYFKTIILLAIMLAICSTKSIFAEDVELLLNDPDGTGESDYATGRNYSLFYISVVYPHPVHQYIIPQAELAAQGGRPGLVNSIALRLHDANTKALNPNARISIYMANVPWSDVREALGYPTNATAYINDGLLQAAGGSYQLVYSMDAFSFTKLHAEHFKENGVDGEAIHYDANKTDEREKWPEFNFINNGQQPFQYTGGGILVKICIGDAYGGGALLTNFKVVNAGTNPYGGKAWKTSATRGTFGSYNCTDPTTFISGSSYRPWLKLGMTLPDLPSKYVNSEILQSTSTAATRPGAENLPILKFALRALDGEPKAMLNNITFNGKASFGIITAAKLYYSGIGNQDASSFDASTAELVATLNFPDSKGNTDIFSFDFTERQLNAGVNNYWLVYDIYQNTPVGENLIDGNFVSMNLYDAEGTIDYDSYAPVDTPDPDGAITIMSHGYRYSGTVNEATGEPTNLWAMDGPNDSYTIERYHMPPPGHNYNMEYMITQYPPEAFGGVSGYIKRLALYVYKQLNYAGLTDMLDNVYIFLKNNGKDDAALPSWPTNIASKLQAQKTGPWNGINMFDAQEFIDLAKKDGFTLVKGPFKWDMNNWPADPEERQAGSNWYLTGHDEARFWTEDIVFDEPFVYDGKGVDVIIFKANWHRAPGATIGTSTRLVKFATPNVNTNYSRYGFAYIDPKDAAIPNPIDGSNQYFTKVPFGTTGDSSYASPSLANAQGAFKEPAPFLRSYVSYIIGQYYQQPFTFQGQAGTAAGAENANVKGICIEVTGEDEAPFIHLKDLTFAGKNDFSLVRTAKLYYSGNDSAFSTNNKVAPDITITSASDINNLKFDLATLNTANGLKLEMGKHFFWLAFEVADNAPTGQTLSAVATGGTIHKVPVTGDATVFDISTMIKDIAPDFKTTINNKMPGGTYTVGSGLETATHYNTLAKLAQDITLRGVAGDVTINIRESISAQDPAIFGVSPSASHIKFTLQSEPNRGILTINNTDNVAANAGNPTIVLSGATNFTIKNLNIKRENYGAAIRLSGASTIAIENTTIEGANNAIDIYKSKDFVFKNNTFLSGTSFAVNITGGSAQGDISENTFGSATGQLASGISMLDGTNNINVYSNYFNSLSGTADRAQVFNIAGLTSRQPLAINIMNNTINDIKAKEIASVFEVANASDVRIYHNTALITNAGDAKNAQVFHLPTNTNSLTVRNNLFSLAVASADNSIHYQFYLIADRAQVFANSEDGNNNLYNGLAGQLVFGRNLNALSTMFSLADWQQNSRYELNSNTSASAVFATTDNHIDGSILDEKGMLCPVLPSDWVQAGNDMDSERGLDISAKYQGYTTVGQDEAKIVIKQLSGDLVEQISCGGSAMGTASFRMEKSFDRWQDNATRTYVPYYRNYWYNTNGEPLTEENGWMANETIQDPVLGINNPSRENTCNLYCITQIGYFESPSNTSSMAVILQPYIPNLEDVYLCEGETRFGLNAVVEGTYTGWRWQKKVNGVWQNTVHTGDGFYDLGFEEDFVNSSDIEGSYRLELLPYSNCGDNTPAYYSNEIKVIVAKPLSGAISFSNSLTYDEYYDGICSNTPNVWYSFSPPANNTKEDVLLYEWWRLVVIDGRLYLDRPLTLQENPTANSDTLKFNYVRQQDAGYYMCVFYGAAACGEDNLVTSGWFELIVNPTPEITREPVSQLICKNAPASFSVETFVPSDYISGITYQWYKDGKAFTGTGATSKSISFASVQESDGGEYYLVMTYAGCDGYQTTYTTPVATLTVKDETRILSQTTKIFGVRGGFATLEVVSNTSNKPLANNAVMYQWYRKYSDARGAVRLTENSKFHGTQTPSLTIVNISNDDMTASAEDYYYCEINDICLSSKLVSAPIKVSEAPDININTQPVSANACEGANVTLSVSASSTDSDYQMSYKWFKAGTTAAIDSGSANLTLENVTLADAADYYCVVSFTSLAGTRKSTNTAKVTIELKPVITRIESNVSLPVDSGNALTLQVFTENPNGNYVYNWYLNGFLIEGYDSAIYHVEETTLLDKGTYHCVVQSVNGCGEAQSGSIEVNILPPDGIFENDDPAFHISQVLPNPVANEATIDFVLPVAGSAILTLIDFSGREIMQLHSGNFSEGTNQVQIHNKLNTVSSGTYFIVLEFGQRKATKKITINR